MIFALTYWRKRHGRFVQEWRKAGAGKPALFTSREEDTMQTLKNLINWKVYFILLIAVTLAGIALLPYALALQTAGTASAAPPPTFSQVLIAQIVQGVPIFAVLVFLGMFLMKRIGLGAPILDALTKGERETAAATLRRVLPISVALGVVASLVIIGLDIALRPLLIQDLGDKASVLAMTAQQPAAWKGFLASFYGGIAEEVQLRLFIMSLLAWLGAFVSRTSEGKPTKAVFWIANLLAAVLFGVGHLPTMALFAPLTALVVFRTLLLNGVGGVVFGWLYQTRGLESAMIAHFSADIVLHVLLALL